MYQAQRYWAWAFVCFFVLGVPLAYLVVLFRYKRHLKPDAKRIMFDVLIDKLREDIARTDDLNLKLTYENNQKKLLADRNKLIMDMSPFKHVLFAKQDPGPPTNDSREIKKGKRDFDAPIPYRDEAARNRIRLIVDIMFHMYGFRLQVTTAEETSALEARKILEAQQIEIHQVPHRHPRPQSRGQNRRAYPEPPSWVSLDGPREIRDGDLHVENRQGRRGGG